MGRRAVGERPFRAGGVTAVQRFGSALELNVHLHNLSFDGVYSFPPGRKPEFHPLPAPTDDDVAEVAAAVVRKMMRKLARRGLGPDGRPIDPDAGGDEDETLTRDGQALLAISSASVQGLVAVGPRAGRRPGRIRGGEASNDNGVFGPHCAQVDGYNLHANVQVRAGDRKGLERLCRYLGRPPLANARLKETGNGRLLIEFKRAWRDGTTHIELAPEELTARLCALVPRPRKHLMRYHGVLAPAFGRRCEIVPPPTAPVEETAPGVDAATTRKIPFPYRHPWAEFLKRVFPVDVLQCPKCPGRMDIVAAVLDRGAVEKVLGAMGLSADIPELRRSRLVTGRTMSRHVEGTTTSPRSGFVHRIARSHAGLLVRAPWPCCCRSISGERSAICTPTRRSVSGPWGGWLRPQERLRARRRCRRAARRRASATSLDAWRRSCR